MRETSSPEKGVPALWMDSCRQWLFQVPILPLDLQFFTQAACENQTGEHSHMHTHLKRPSWVAGGRGSPGNFWLSSLGWEVRVESGVIGKSSPTLIQQPLAGLELGGRVEKAYGRGRPWHCCVAMFPRGLCGNFLPLPHGREQTSCKTYSFLGGQSRWPGVRKKALVAWSMYLYSWCS